MLPAPSNELDDYALDMPARGDIPDPKKLLPTMKDWANSIMEMFSGISSSIQATFDRLRGGFDDIFKSFRAGSAEGGILGGIAGALEPIGSMVGLLTKVPEIVKQVWASIKYFAKGIASLFNGIGDFIKNIDTHLFLFIKQNNLLPQQCFAKAGYVETGGKDAMPAKLIGYFSATDSRVGTTYLAVRFSLLNK